MNPQVSIIIDNYNYGRYLPQAIDSALNQTIDDVEVIVMDDGSCDNSRQVIESYQTRIRAILKDNGGQASALNAGFQLSRGRVVIFLDADDMLAPTAAEVASCWLDRTGAAKVHWPMRVIDASGLPTGRLHPSGPLPDGEFADTLIGEGPWMADNPPTSGNAWSREFLSQVMPIPPHVYQVCPDLYLAALAPMYGPIGRIQQPQSCWRAHGQNQTWSQPFEQRLQRLIWRWDVVCEALIEHSRARDLPVDPRRWKSMAWCHRVHAAIQDICAVVPPGQAFVLIDGNEWGTHAWLHGRRRIAFMQRHGQFWGLPGSDDEAMAELELRRSQGVGFVALAWGSLWWRQHYAQFIGALQSRFPVLLHNDRVIIYDVRTPTRQAVSCTQPASSFDGTVLR